MSSITEQTESMIDTTATYPERFQRLLREFGASLGFACDCPSSHLAIWSRPDSLQLTFTLLAEHIRVTASPFAHPDVQSLWGTLAYDDLESAVGGHAGESMISTVPRCLLLNVLSNDRVCRDHHLMHLELPADAGIDPEPGQFFNVLCDVEGDGRQVPLTLRRPFSLHGVVYDCFQRTLLAHANELPTALRAIIRRQPIEINFLYKVVGEGTRALTQVQPGQQLDVIGPLGHGFHIDEQKTAVIVAGGIGAAPLVALAEHLRYHNIDVHLYTGAATQEFLAPTLCRPDQRCGNTSEPPEFRKLIVDEFREIGVDAGYVHICTDDGSEGEHGFATDILERHLSGGQLAAKDVQVYACGPHGMLKALAGVTARHGIACQVLMEERMACGIGACMACVCKVKGPDGEERKRVCKDGPVFDAHEVLW